MRISDTDPSEVGGGSRKIWWVASGILALCIGGAVFALVGGDHGTSDESTVPVTAQPSVADTVPAPAGPATTVPGYPDSGSDYLGDPLTVLARRTTPDGISLVLYALAGFQSDSSQPLVPGAVISISSNAGGVITVSAGNAAPAVAVPAPPTTLGVVPPRIDVSVGSAVGSSPGGWNPPAWCFATGSYRLTSVRNGSVSVANGPTYAPSGQVRVTLHDAGQADGTPYRVMVAQVPADVTSVTVRFADGVSDTAPAAGGYAVLAAPGGFNGKFSLRLTGSQGKVTTVDWTQIPAEGDARWQRACTPPPPGLPAPGAQQPANPDAERTAISNQFDLLFRSSKPFAERRAALDDATGVADALDQVGQGQFGDAAKQAEYAFGDLVFASPTRAWFQYELTANGTHFTGRFGEANRIGGSWKISRATICQDIALAGVACQPPTDPVQPPGPAGVSGDT